MFPQMILRPRFSSAPGRLRRGLFLTVIALGVVALILLGARRETGFTPSAEQYQCDDAQGDHSQEQSAPQPARSRGKPRTEYHLWEHSGPSVSIRVSRSACRSS